MSRTLQSLSSTSTLPLPPSAPAAARAVSRLLTGLRHGRLDLQMPDGSQARFGSADAPGPHAAIRLANWKVCGAALRSGDIGFAESYIAGDWSTPDLVALMKLFVAHSAWSAGHDQQP